MDSNSPESAPADPLDQLRRFAERRGVSSDEAGLLLRAELERLREPGAKMSQTLFFMAGVRSISLFARDRARLSAAGPLSAVEWSEAEGAVSAAMTPENRRRVRDDTQSLPDELQAIYRLLVLGNKSYAEIAQQLGISVESIQARVFRAKEILLGRLAALITETP